MNIMHFWRRAQTSIVYAALVAFVVASLIAMAVYLRRAFQGKARESAEVFGAGALYQPGVTTITSN